MKDKQILVLIRVYFWRFNATFSNISAISWRPVLVVEEARVPGENHRPWASNWKTVSLAVTTRVHPFCNLQSRARTHGVLVIGLYELLGNPTNLTQGATRARFLYDIRHAIHIFR